MTVGPTLEQIHSTLVAAYNKLKLSSGKYLTADNIRHDTVSGGAYPFLSFNSGRFTLSRWTEFEELLSWDIPATLVVQGPVQDGELVARAAVQDIMLRTKQVQGLPLDENGKIVSLEQALRRYDEDDLDYLVDRGAPFIKTVVFKGEQDGLCAVDFIFTVEALLSFDTRDLKLMKVGVLGVNAVPPAGLYQDPSIPDGRGVKVVFGTEDEKGFGGYASGDPSFPYPTRDPIQPGGTASVAGDPNPVVEVRVTPYAAAISAGTPTTQLTAIARYQNYLTNYVTQQGAWSSDTPSVATVNASGVVTRVGAGTTNITCTFGGVQSNAAVITSS